METLEDIKKAIMVDPQNQVYTERGIEPLFAAPKSARINIVGQAPGIKAQETRLYWNDKSGDRLREWMGVDYDTFYHSGYFYGQEKLVGEKGVLKRIIEKGTFMNSIF